MIWKYLSFYSVERFRTILALLFILSFVWSSLRGLT